MSSTETMEQAINKRNTGAPERVFVAEFKLQLMFKASNKFVKPDVDEAWDNSELGKAWQAFLKLAHADNTAICDGIRVIRVYDEGPHIKRLQISEDHLP